MRASMAAIVSGLLAVLIVSIVASSLIAQNNSLYYPAIADNSEEATQDIVFRPSSDTDALFRKEVGDFLSGRMSFEEWVRYKTGEGDSWVIVRVDDIVLLDNVTYPVPPNSDCRVHAGPPPAILIASVEDVIWGDKSLAGKRIRLISPFIKGDPSRCVVTYAAFFLPLLPNMEYLIRVGPPIEEPTASAYIACPTENGYTDTIVSYTILKHEVRSLSLFDVFVIRGDRAYYILSPTLPQEVATYAELRTQSTLTYTGDEDILANGASIGDVAEAVREALNGP